MKSFDIITVRVEVDDTFFERGINILIKDFFQTKNSIVRFVFKESADLLISTDNNHNFFCKKIFIASKKSPSSIIARQCTCKNVIFKNDSLKRVLCVIERTLTEKEITKTCSYCRRTLTRRQKDVLFHISQGRTHGEISKILGLHVKTISQHKRNAMRKLSLHNTKELLTWLKLKNH